MWFFVSQDTILTTSKVPWVIGINFFLGMFTDTTCLKYPEFPSRTGANVRYVLPSGEKIGEAGGSTHPEPSPVTLCVYK